MCASIVCDYDNYDLHALCPKLMCVVLWIELTMHNGQGSGM